MRKDEGLVGKKFGRLLVKEQIETKEPLARGKPRYYRCSCDCGNESHEVRGYGLASGDVRSCGCLQREVASKTVKDSLERRTKHGACIGTHTKKNVNKALLRTYTIWIGIKTRCRNQNEPTYARYGGRGISICDKWLNSFESFLSDMGVCPEGLSIERIDNDGNYEPNNCIWADRWKQANNKPGFNRVIEYNGISRSISEWAAELGINKHTLFNRINRGWAIERTITQPVRSK